MNVEYVVVLFFIGFIGSFISGMVGIGGSIVNYPLLLYVPTILGIATFTAHEVSGITAIQVFFATLISVLFYRKGEYLNKGLIITMGTSVLLGSAIGSYFSKFMEEGNINLIYGILALIAVIMMFFPKKKDKKEEEGLKKVSFNKYVASFSAFIVGICAGIVGAAGAFILVPIMLVVLKIPTRVTIASSLAITFISSIGSTIGKITTGQIVYLPAIIMIFSSLIASPLGVKVGKKMNTKILKWILALLILSASIKIWFGILS